MPTTEAKPNIVESIYTDGRILGIVNHNLFPELAAEFGSAFGTWLGKGSVVVVARDFRNDTHVIKRSCTGGIMSSGVDILDLLSAPTSALQFIVRRFGANAGLSFTSSHYVKGEMSIRLIDASGNELGSNAVQEILSILSSKRFTRVDTKSLGYIKPINNSTDIYRNALLGFIKGDVIQKNHFSIVVDCSLGPSSQDIPNIISELGADVTTMNSYTVSPVDVLPDAKSLQRMSRTIKAIDSQLGIAIDVEGVKVVAADDSGKIIPPEDLTALIIFEYLKEHKGTIVLSNYFTRRFDEAFTSNGSTILHVADSPGNIGRSISNERAIIGATDNGKLFNPVWGPESDGILTTLTLLEILTKRKMALSDLMVELESYRCKSTEVASSNSSISLPSMVSQNQLLYDLHNLLLKHKYPYRDTLVGYNISYKSGWAHFFTTTRSNEIQIICETSKSDELASISDFAMEIFREVIREIVNKK